MKNQKRLLAQILAVTATVGVIGYSAPRSPAPEIPAAEVGGLFGRRDWNAENDPEILAKFLKVPFEYQLSKLPVKGMIATSKMPWSETYWPSYRGGIAIRWNAGVAATLPGNTDAFSSKLFSKEELKLLTPAQISALSPAEKYDIAMGRYDYPTVLGERSRTNPKQATWEGICHGWIQAAINHGEPRANTIVNADGISVPFGVSDVNGLLSYYYGVKMYDHARGKRWVGHYQNSIQYLDAVDTLDPAGWVDIGSNTQAVVDRWITPTNNQPVSCVGASQVAGVVKDSALCEDDSHLRSMYIPGTYLAAHKELVSGCGDRDASCRAAVVESLLANEHEKVENQCINDSQAMAYFPELDNVKQVGQRLDQKRGWIFKTRPGILDVNPGAWHVIITNMIGTRGEAFGSNINPDLRNGEVWNQPVVGFDVKYKNIDEPGNADGKRKVKVSMTVYYVKEIGQHYNPVVGTSRQNIAQETYDYKLFLDDAGHITGGKWAERANHPNFVWVQSKLDFRGYFSKLNEIYQPNVAQ